MASSNFVLLCLVASSISMLTFATDQNPMQDFCVADPTVKVLMNGLPCKDPTAVHAGNFYFTGLNQTGNTSNPFGSAVTLVSVSEIPGLNTLGISLVRVDYAPGGVNPPHTHPRASEIITVLEGSLEAGFVTSSPENRRISRVLQKGDVFVFPIGLVHYQKNVGPGSAVAIAALSSQNPGVVFVAEAVFGSVPEFDDDFLERSFKLDKLVVEHLKSKF